MAERRRKHWGWGYEDEQPGLDELRATVAGLADHLGYGEREPEPPVRARRRRAARRRGSRRRTRTTPGRARRTPRAAPTSTSCAGCAASSRTRPTASPSRRSEDELRAVLDWCGEHDVAVVPFGGGTSVVGGVDAIPGPGHAGVVTVNLRGLDRVLEVDPVSRAARIQAGATGPGLEAQLARARADACASTRSRSSSRRSAAGSRRAPAGTSRPARPTSTTSSSRCAR